MAAHALLPGCTWFVSVPELTPLPKTTVVLRDVAYVGQEAQFDCGPACLATVLRHYGSTATLDQLSSEMKQTDDGGVIMVEMVFQARKRRYDVEVYEGGLNDLRRKVLVGRPLILLLHPMPDMVRHVTSRRGHYVVAVGFDDRRRDVIVHSGREAFTRMSYRRLLAQWRRANCLTLLVRGKRETGRPAGR
jgi:ABC-type bacteriocin/lantibiotic exporter with double-glycine peptidase domain